jgi:argininosuccinate lyase
MALWDGRFSGDTDALVARFSESISFDRRLYRQDIQGSTAHVRMLARCGIIPPADADAIVAELARLQQDIEGGKVEFEERLEDIHMNLESRLIERLGDSGARVHTARSRNDQVGTDVRLYLREEIDAIRRLLQALQASLVGLADAHRDVILPGFTHLQHAQPVLLAHHLLAYVEMLARDDERLVDARRRVNRLPLGAGALAGTTLPIDRHSVAAELGFEETLRNSMDAVSDRDFMVELLAALSLIMTHLSRLSEDLILWSSQEFAFIELDDAFCTGSSLMPQKKNPDIAELTRGKTGRVYGALVTLLTVMKGLPLGYNRDLQEDKEPVFDAIDTVKAALAVYAPMIAGARVNGARMAAAAADPALMATDLAEQLVRLGVPFRDAHRQVGRFVAYCRDRGIGLDEADLAAMRTCIPQATEDCLTLFDARRSVMARDSYGGTAPRRVAEQLDFWRARLERHE